jgi:hypothetical protein
MTIQPTADDVRSLVRTVDAPLPAPIYGGPAMAQALTAYRELQRALDQSMPDQILELSGRQFRKKGYWRAISVAFNLSVELVDERRDVRGSFEDGRENFGYVVVCRATAPNGRTAVGDGSVFAIEKARRDVDKWATLPAQATEHNVRSHAVTRAYNRAVSNLVGFGEASAEEADTDDVPACPRDAALITAKQQARFFTLAKKAGWTTEGIRVALLDQFGIRNTAAITQDRYDAICVVFAQPPAAASTPDPDPPL